MRKSKTDIPLIIFDKRVPERVEIKEPKAQPLVNDQDHLITQEQPIPALEILLHRLWLGIQRLFIAMKHRAFVFVKQHFGEVQIPWFKLSILALAAYVLLVKDMQFNIALQAPLAGVLADREDDGNAHTASFQSDLAPASIAMIKDKKASAFIKKYAPTAVSEMKQFNVPASIKMAQAIIESRAGQSRLAVQSNNFFGIKCKAKCLGCTCKNYADDGAYDMFRVFQSPMESWREHSELLQIERYKKLQRFGKDYRQWAVGLKKAGYATDKNYDKKLIDVIEKYQLYKLDNL